VTRASVIIPCHNKSGTLALVVDSVLRQTVQDLEVLMLGDGVTDEARAAILELVAADERVRFLDFPKGPHHGEAYRHDAVLAASSDAIFYLCDDDLLLPEHVSDLLALLEDANVVQSLGSYIRPDGRFGSYAGDLADAELVAAVLDESIRFNFVSITGTAHSKSYYLETGAHWETTPDGIWPDHHEFRKLARHPGYRGATSHRVTALQLPTTNDGREDWTAEERVAELARWHAVVVAPDGQEQVDALHHQGLISDVARLRLLESRLTQDVDFALTQNAHQKRDFERHVEILQGDFENYLRELEVVHNEREQELARRQQRQRRLRRDLTAAQRELETLRARADRPWWRRG